MSHGPLVREPSGDGADGVAGVAGYWRLLLAVLRKRVLLLVRYPVNTLGRLLGVYLFFVVVFFGGRAAATAAGGGGVSLGDTLDGLVVGWFLWTMSLTAYFGLSATVTQEASWGTLEQLYMSPYGFGSVMLATVAVRLLESLFWGGSILALILLTTGRRLAVDLLTVVPVSLLTLLPVVGVGFAFAGLALLFKRVSNLNQFVQFALIGLIAAPASGVGWLRYLPLVQGSGMLQRAMRDGVRLWEFAPAELAVLVGTGAVYAAVGYLLFDRMQRRARRQGLLGEY